MLAGELDRSAGIECDYTTTRTKRDFACAEQPHPGDGVDSDGFDLGEGRAAPGPEECCVGQCELFGVCREGSPDLVCEVGQGGDVSSRWRIAGFGGGERGTERGQSSLWDLARDDRVIREMRFPESEITHLARIQNAVAYRIGLGEVETFELERRDGAIEDSSRREARIILEWGQPIKSARGRFDAYARDLSRPRSRDESIRSDQDLR